MKIRLHGLAFAAAALALGQSAWAGEAEATLSRGISALDSDPRPKMPGERALWLYKRGAARVLLNRPADAQADLAVTLQSSPIEWVRGRLNLELGKLADLGGRRPEAVAFDVTHNKKGKPVDQEQVAGVETFTPVAFQNCQVTAGNHIQPDVDHTLGWAPPVS